MYAFNRPTKALDYLRPMNTPGARWTAKLNIGKGVGHTQINLHVNDTYAGTLQGDILGAALYKNRNENGLEGSPIPLTWQKVVAGVNETYSHPTSWGTWFCHDITAAVFRRWGLNEQDVYRAAYPHTPGGRIGLVTARIVALLLVPGTTAMLGIHEVWNGFQDAWRRLTRW